jgi:hypothetical protein
MPGVILQRTGWLNWQQYILDAGDVSTEQLAEARSFAKERSLATKDALLKLGYTDPWHITRAYAKANQYPVLNFYDDPVPETTIRTIPELVFRDLKAFPVAIDNGVLWYATPSFGSTVLQQKLESILNRPVSPMWAPETWFATADSMYYCVSHYTQAMTIWYFSRYGENDWLLEKGNRYSQFLRDREFELKSAK